MKILSVADRVDPILMEMAAVNRYGGTELILSCGDVSPEYLLHLQRMFDVPLFYVRGNHDIRYQSKPLGPCVNIHGRLVKYKNLKFLGLEGSRWYNGGPAQYTEGEMRKKVRHLRARLWWNQGVDVVVTHAPPRHIHDAEDLCHRGFKTFRWLIDRYRPACFLHGHIHTIFSDPSQRITLINGTRVINSYGHYYFEAQPYGVTF